ncbi:MAG: septal ring lytic transglycosylase RlpA family protein [Bacteroidia bacterium]|nr:septal ring lytic transglycosylase RlpA family protein [Bacteroidia bacterium]
MEKYTNSIRGLLSRQKNSWGKYINILFLGNYSHFVFSIAILGFLIMLHNSLFAQLGYTQKGAASYYADKFHGRFTASGERYDRNQLTAAHKTIAFQSIVKVTNISNGKTVTVRINDRGPHSPGRIIDVSYNAAKELGILASGTGNVKIEVIGLNGKNPEIHNNIEKTETTTTKEQNPPIETSKQPEKIIEIKPPQPEKETPKQPENTPPPQEVKKQPIDITIFKKSGIYNLDGSKATVTGWGIQLGAFRDLENALRIAETAKQKGYSRVFIWAIAKKNSTLYKITLGIYNDKATAKKNITEINTKGLSGSPIEYPN